jgi:hypothetical protein
MNRNDLLAICLAAVIIVPWWLGCVELFRLFFAFFLTMVGK